MKTRLLSIIICFCLVLSGSSFAFASSADASDAGIYPSNDKLLLNGVEQKIDMQKQAGTNFLTASVAGKLFDCDEQLIKDIAETITHKGVKLYRLRSIAERVGAKIMWDGKVHVTFAGKINSSKDVLLLNDAEQKVGMKKKNNTNYISAAEAEKMFGCDESKLSDISDTINYEGVKLYSLRSVAERVGARITWDGKIHITFPDSVEGETNTPEADDSALESDSATELDSIAEPDSAPIEENDGSKTELVTTDSDDFNFKNIVAVATEMLTSYGYHTLGVHSIINGTICEDVWFEKSPDEKLNLEWLGDRNEGRGEVLIMTTLSGDIFEMCSTMEEVREVLKRAENYHNNPK